VEVRDTEQDDSRASRWHGMWQYKVATKIDVVMPVILDMSSLLFTIEFSLFLSLDLHLELKATQISSLSFFPIQPLLVKQHTKYKRGDFRADRLATGH
jgi:hypothetical protein